MTISVHATKNVFILMCFVSSLLKIPVSALTTRTLKHSAKNSPDVFKANIVIGIPMMQIMIVKP